MNARQVAAEKHANSEMSPWREPALRHPAPSFMDYRGLERQGVLENMMPLGVTPSSKIKSRARADPLRRVMPARPSESAGLEDERLTPAAESIAATSVKSDDESAPTTPVGTMLLQLSTSPKLEPTSPVSFIEPSEFGHEHSHADHDTIRGESYRQHTPEPEAAMNGEQEPHKELANEDERAEVADNEDDDVAHSAGPGAIPHIRAPYTRSGAGKINLSTIHAAGSRRKSVSAVSLPPAPPRGPLPQGSTIEKAFKDAARRAGLNYSHAVPWLKYLAQQDSEFAKALHDVAQKSPNGEQKALYSAKIHQLKKFAHTHHKDHSTQGFNGPVSYDSMAGSASSGKRQTRSSSRFTFSNSDGVNNARNISLEPFFTPDFASTAQALKSSQSEQRDHKPSITLKLHHSSASSSQPSSQSFQSQSRALSPLQTPSKITRNVARTRSTRSTSRPALQYPMIDQSTSEEIQGHVPAGSIIENPVQAIARLTAHPSLKRSLEDSAVTEDIERARKRYRADLLVDIAAIETSYVRPQMKGSLTTEAPDSACNGTEGRIANKRDASDALLHENDEVDDGSASPTVSENAAKRIKRQTPRSKQSPQKKDRQAVTAGIPPETKLNSLVDTDTNQEFPNNSDFCVTCSGTGHLICCDGCTGSYHFTCLDPPIREESDIKEDPWYCYDCKATHGNVDMPPPGLFNEPLAMLARRNPSSFRLRADIALYFANTEIGESGEYSEQIRKNPMIKSRNGVEEKPDYRRLRDPKGSLITCTHCGLSAKDGREIIPCNYCDAQWHLDCVDPPMAVAPTLRSNTAWMCPLHVDHDLRGIDPIVPRVDVPYGSLRFHRTRRARTPRIINTHLRRGHRNNGVIEIAPEEPGRSEIDISSDGNTEEDATTVEEDGEESDAQGDEEGAVYRLPERGVRLDFIHRVKTQRAMQQRMAQQIAQRQRLHNLQLEARNLELQHRQLQTYALIERRTAVDLVDFAANEQVSELSGSTIHDLVTVLRNEAPLEVLQSLDCGTSEHVGKAGRQPYLREKRRLGENERENLMRLQRLIARRLEADGHSQSSGL